MTSAGRRYARKQGFLHISPLPWLCLVLLTVVDTLAIAPNDDVVKSPVCIVSAILRLRLAGQRGGSGASLLRARRLLRERNAHDDSSTGRLLREGLDQFLSDLTRQRDALESSQRWTLVIQHQFPSKSTALDPTLKTPRPTEPPTYRLLSSDATRVLRIESPVAALHSVETTAASYPQSTDLQHHHGLLAATNVMRDLKAQEAQQGAAILRAERGKRESHYRRRASAASATQEAAARNSERVSGGSAMSEAQHQNIVQLLKNGGAASLYSGVALPPQSSEPTARASLVAGAARVVTRKHDRHFRSELLFPPVARGTHASQSKRLT
ncbi:hypothetical protein BBJ28_00017696 [Nothophytophthora sp. Chile5]|nr:hypothetical protein BBJ28_00017696 [Nothophytophthora sp. Chile5]